MKRIEKLHKQYEAKKRELLELKQQIEASTDLIRELDEISTQEKCDFFDSIYERMFDDAWQNAQAGYDVREDGFEAWLFEFCMSVLHQPGKEHEFWKQFKLGLKLE